MKRKFSKGDWADEQNVDINRNDDEEYPDEYNIDSVIGQETYVQVFEAFDREELRNVAIKIIKNSRTNLWAAHSEIRLLKMLNNADSDNICHIVTLKGTFIWRRCMCLVFELLSYDLVDVLNKHGRRGISLNMTREFGRQLCTALNFLSELNVIHCDIKPNNIVLCDPKKYDIKVIDFGAAYQIGQRSRVVYTMDYTSPEVLLGFPRTAAIDMWSLGCTLAEIQIGSTLFKGEDEVDQMDKIVEVLGMPPNHLLDKGPKTRKFFIKTLNVEYVLRRNINGKNYLAPGTRDLVELLGVRNGRHSVSDCLMFKQLIYRMLDYDPETRVTPYNALRHVFFKITSDKGASTSRLPELLICGAATKVDWHTSLLPQPKDTKDGKGNCEPQRRLKALSKQIHRIPQKTCGGYRDTMDSLFFKTQHRNMISIFIIFFCYYLYITIRRVV